MHQVGKKMDGVIVS